MTNFATVPEFDNDLKHLLKRFPSLKSDIERFKIVLGHNGPRPPGIVRISGVGSGVSDPVYKVRHFRCESLKGKGSRSGIRIIFGHEESDNNITFIQIYHKSDSTNHDPERIKKYFE